MPPPLLLLLLSFIGSVALAASVSPRCRGILRLLDGSVLSPRYENIDSRDVGTALAERFHRRYEVDADVSSDSINLFSPQFKIALAFDGEFNGDQIIQNGFRNYHQTGRTGGESNRRQRAIHIHELIGVELERYYDATRTHWVHEIRPKSAYLFFGELPVVLGPTKIWGQYGNSFAILKNKNKQRALWTNSDALAVGRKDVHSFSQKLMTLPKSTSAVTGELYFYETLVLGELTRSDVQEWWIDYSPAEVRDLKAVQGGFLNNLLRTDIPVFRYHIVDYDGRKEPERIGRRIRLENN